MTKPFPLFGSGRLREGPMRAAVLLIMAAQLVAFPLAATTDVHPAETGHVEHVSGDDQACQPFHDELTCLTCRVLSNDAAPIALFAVLAPAAPILDTATVSGADEVQTDPRRGNVGARGPPNHS